MMLEKDYIELAKKQKEQEMMDDYWLNIARTSTWISKDGTKTYFKDLELAHIQRIISGLMTFENKNCKIVIDKLIIELIVRIKRKAPKYAFEFLDKLTELASKNASEEELTDIERYKINILANLTDKEGRKL